MRSRGGGGENFEGDRDVDFYRLPSQYQIILLMTEMVAVMVKMMRVVSLMVAMAASMGRPFAFSLANLPVFPKDDGTRAVVHHRNTLHCFAFHGMGGELHNCWWEPQLYSNDQQSAAAQHPEHAQSAQLYQYLVPSTN